MAFIALGINHKTASVDVRERVAFTPERLVEALQLLCQTTVSREAAILSTCNRSELYLEQDALSVDEVLAWLAGYHQLNIEDLRACAYVYQEADAVRHMMRVACGLDSMVLGEPQILGQMKSAFAVAREAGTMGPLLGRLFQATFNTAKQVRTDTAIGENPVSVAFAAVSLAKQIFSDLHRSQALLIGAGETIGLVARHLHDQGIKRIVVANRTLERASTLAEQFGAHAVLLSDIPAELAKSDIVISSTASQLPILGKGAVESALKQRKHKPIFMVDIAVPRDIEPEVGELDDVYLYTVDDLHEVIAENLKSRQGAAQAAEDLVSNGADDFMARLRELAAVDVLKAYRQQAERLRDEELGKALRALNNGVAAEDVMAQLARGLTNKLLHAPSVQMKKLSADGRIDALTVAQELFALNEGASSNKGL
ncbi:MULTISPECIES: glutamyl-tRNA reductase [Pseudomonas]|jgi:glutamyl-tRNA reductase|uniref:Glutamyl-tRNA reductase n=1 Tax=Pseudomonas marincola TaxID=437900 RepID=A0A1I7DY32_9PSED|nr:MULTISPECIES: glutamyl-tRNA reductase [Pseudomonas]MAB96644.1 glutamyl-tRNA reductase [Pseudomonadaceae bacterium]MBQ55387.1 glutamyl-tRNA reductase [Pseudomonadaceae bacterium]NRH26236.1 glutamyl-tRNA reductase [Pseudomonas sp. MS19]OEO23719.1 glutamyl-tRNA reductase [Pseudomonas sp. J237]CAE6893931.1 glutamyl-tRNA reductase [Pseudomonas marincola]